MPVELIRGQVTRQVDGDWQFGYVKRGMGPVGTVGSHPLSAEVVQRIWEQVLGPLPATELGESEIVHEWDRLEPVRAIEIERRVRGI
jgi:hypothetical protein